MAKHYDIEASRTAFFEAAAEAGRQIDALPGDPDDIRFRAAQRRFAPAKIALRVNLLEAANEGEPAEMTLAALATTVAVVLHNLADEAGLNEFDACADFTAGLAATLDAMAGRYESEEEMGGVVVRSDPVLATVGHA